MTHGQLIKKLREMVAAEGSQAALATKLGVSRSYLSEIFKGTRTPGKKVLAQLGLESRTVYTAKEAAA